MGGEEMNWQPIKTAPLDEEVLVIHLYLGIVQARKCSKMVESKIEAETLFPWDSPASDGLWLYTRDLSHWMPLPEPPAEDKK
jgi:hypothetical protein